MRLKALFLIALGAFASGAVSAQTKVATTPPAKAVGLPGTRISGTLQCGKTKSNVVDVGDDAGHALAVGKTPCTWTKPMTIGGAQTKEGSSSAVSDVRGDVSADHGYHVGTMSSGDKYYVRFDGQTQSSNGVARSQSGRWGFTGGTGKLTGLRGRGTFKGTVNADGSMTVEVEGEYRLAEPAK